MTTQGPAMPETSAEDRGLLERSEELAAIESVLDAARAGAGHCLVLEGRAGLGKSRLASAAAAGARDASMTLLRGSGAELEQDFSFGVVLQLFEALVMGGEGDDELLSGPAALARPLFESEEARRAPAESEFPLLHGLHWLAANAAERAPLVAIVDDAHWADAPSLRFLLYLLQRLDELPIALIVTARPDEPSPQTRFIRRITRHALARTRSLEPLSSDAVALLVRAALGPDADDDLCAAGAAATGGNPFYVTELIAGLRARGESAATAAMRGEPASVAVLDRVEALGDAARELASAAAVLGDGAPLARAAWLAGIDVDEAAAVADALADAAVLERGALLAFVHPIVRDAVYSALPEASRARAHARAAEMLDAGGADAERVAAQLVQAQGAAGEWAVPALRKAAALARGRGAPAAAVRYLREALATLTREADRGEVLLELALAEAKAREKGAPERAEQAIDALPTRRRKAEAALDLGMSLMDSFQPEAAAVFSRGLDALVDPTDEDEELVMTLRSARAAIAFGHAAAAPGDLEAILERAARGAATPAERLMLAHGALGHGLRGDSIEDLRRLARASLQGPPPDVTSPTVMSGYSLAATALMIAGDFEESERAMTPALASARERGSVLSFGVLSHARAHLQHRRGRLEEAIADAQSALDAVRYGWNPELPAVHAVLALCMIERGELGAAEAALDVSGGEERWSHSFTWADLLDARGRLHLARGEAQAALDAHLACGERLKPLGASHTGVVPWRPGAVEAALQVGDVALGGQLANEDVELARAFGAPRELGMALRASGLVAGGDRGLALFREAVDVLRPSGAALELAHALASLGNGLLEEGHRLAAREPLAEALDLAHACHADALEESARTTLVSTGARPRRASTRGSDALTPRERRIAQMAVEGHGNRDIAAALFITTKTVETRLGRVYRKLGVTGRGGLAEALRE